MLFADCAPRRSKGLLAEERIAGAVRVARLRHCSDRMDNLLKVHI
jgi:hypothetical protein